MAEAERGPVKDINLANVRKGFWCKRLPQSRGSFAMTVRNSPLSQFPAERVLTRNDTERKCSGCDAEASDANIGFFWPYLFFFQRKGAKGAVGS